MSPRRRAAVAGIVAACGLVGLTAAIAAVDSVDRSGPTDETAKVIRPNAGNLTAQALAVWPGYAVYWAGETFESSPVTRMKHVSESVLFAETGQRPRHKLPPPIPSTRHQPELDYVSVIYGGCELDDSDTPSCVPPLEIQTWRGCNRTLSDIDYGVGVPVEYKRLSIGGASAAAFPDGRIEIYTGSSTIAVFADSPERAARAAHVVTSANMMASDENPEPPTLRPAPSEVVAGTGARCGAVDS